MAQTKTANKTANKSLTVATLPKSTFKKVEGLTDPTTLSLDKFIHGIASSAVMNLPQYKGLKDICKAMVAFSKERGIPMSFLAYIGVSTSAHKLNGFLKTYKQWNPTKAAKVCDMAAYMAAHFADTKHGKPTDKVYHACYTIEKTLIDDMDAFRATVDIMDKVNSRSKCGDIVVSFNACLSEVLAISAARV